MASKIDGTNGLLQNYVYLDGTTTPSISTGFSYTVPSGIQNVILNPASTFAAGTVILPASPVDGMTVTMSTTQQITSFTVSASSGQSVSGGFSGTPFQAKTAVSYVYNQNKTTWYPFTAISPYILPAPSTSGNLLTSDGTIWGSQPASTAVGVLASIGINQTWTQFTTGTQRALGTQYTNSTGRPIVVFISGHSSNAAMMNIRPIINGVTLGQLFIAGTGGGDYYGGNTFLIPVGATYQFDLYQGGSGITNWWELR